MSDINRECNFEVVPALGRADANIMVLVKDKMDDPHNRVCKKCNIPLLFRYKIIETEKSKEIYLDQIEEYYEEISKTFLNKKGSISIFCKCDPEKAFSLAVIGNGTVKPSKFNIIWLYTSYKYENSTLKEDDYFIAKDFYKLQNILKEKKDDKIEWEEFLSLRTEMSKEKQELYT